MSNPNGHLLPNSILCQSELDHLKMMANSGLVNYAGIPGISSHLIGGPKHGKVRLFQNSREQRTEITPHSHRFDLLCLVLRGEVVNQLWKQAPDDCHRADKYVASLMLYEGGPGELVRTETLPAYAYACTEELYECGQFYSMRAHEIHSIRFSRDAVVLFFEGPEVTAETMILEPFVEGRRVPTFHVAPWMYQPQDRPLNQGGELSPAPGP